MGVCVSTYFLRPNVFSVHRFLARCMAEVMGHFVPKIATPNVLPPAPFPPKECAHGWASLVASFS